MNFNMEELLKYVAFYLNLCWIQTIATINWCNCLEPFKRLYFAVFICGVPSVFLKPSNEKSLVSHTFMGDNPKEDKAAERKSSSPPLKQDQAKLEVTGDVVEHKRRERKYKSTEKEQPRDKEKRPTSKENRVKSMEGKTNEDVFARIAAGQETASPVTNVPFNATAASENNKGHGHILKPGRYRYSPAFHNIRNKDAENKRGSNKSSEMVLRAGGGGPATKKESDGKQSINTRRKSIQLKGGGGQQKTVEPFNTATGGKTKERKKEDKEKSSK